MKISDSFLERKSFIGICLLDVAVKRLLVALPCLVSILLSYDKLYKKLLILYASNDNFFSIIHYKKFVVVNEKHGNCHTR